MSRVRIPDSSQEGRWRQAYYWRVKRSWVRVCRRWHRMALISLREMNPHAEREDYSLKDSTHLAPRDDSSRGA